MILLIYFMSIKIIYLRVELKVSLPSSSKMLTVAVSAFIPLENWAEGSDSDPCTIMVSVDSSKSSFMMGMSRLCAGDPELLPEVNVRRMVTEV